MAESPRLDRLARELLLLAFPHVTADAWPIEQLTNMLGEERLLQPGDVLFREGATADELFFMVRGGVTLRAAGRPDWPFAGRWVVGTFEALLGGPHRRTALVDVETLVLPVRTEEWLELAEENFELAQGTLLNMTRSLAGLWRRVWSSGSAGAEVRLRLERDGSPKRVSVRSADRASFLKSPRLH